MKKMLSGIFLLLLAIWSLIYGVVDDFGIGCLIGVILPIAALISFAIGYFEKKQ